MPVVLNLNEFIVFSFMFIFTPLLKRSVILGSSETDVLCFIVVSSRAAWKDPYCTLMKLMCRLLYSYSYNLYGNRYIYIKLYLFHSQ